VRMHSKSVSSIGVQSHVVRARTKSYLDCGEGQEA